MEIEVHFHQNCSDSFNLLKCWLLQIAHLPTQQLPAASNKALTLTSRTFFLSKSPRIRAWINWKLKHCLLMQLKFSPSVTWSHISAMKCWPFYLIVIFMSMPMPASFVKGPVRLLLFRHDFSSKKGNLILYVLIVGTRYYLYQVEKIIIRVYLLTKFRKRFSRIIWSS